MADKRKPSWHFDASDINVNQHPSVKKLTPVEKCYMLGVEHGDLATVKRILERTVKDSTSINIDCVDPLGRSAVIIAIDNENFEMLKLLLLEGVQVKDGLLHAINVEYVEAVELLLDHEECIETGEKYSWETVDKDIAMFSPEISPLMLAAHKDNYEILKLLLDRNATMPMPHEVKCKCNECLNAVHEDCLRHSRTRINAYRALSSPSLICLTSFDPVLTAFELSGELKRLSLIENEFKEEYLILRKTCQEFAVALLDHVRTSDELQVILSHDTSDQIIKNQSLLSRIELALKCDQKKFVAHPNVQQLLSSLWYEGLPGFRRSNVFQKLWQIIKIGVLFPVYSWIYMICPTSSSAKLMEKPFVKFIVHAFSYLFFLFLLILASQRVETLIIELFGTEEMKFQMTESLKKQRGNLPTIIEISILIYVISYIWQETRELWARGIVEYFQNTWNIIDFIRNTLYVLTIILRGWAYIQANSEISKYPDNAFIPREEWDAFDPTLIADGLFAAGNIFSAFKLIHLFSINPHLGPLQVSLGRMAIDIVKFFFIYTLVLFSFACGLNQLLWYYADMEKKICYDSVTGQAKWDKNRDSCLAWRRFSNLFESSQSLFWASFGLVDLANFELTGIKSYTRFWGMLMFGSYCVINVVVLLNLLIAMMSNSYQIISARADTEWKFARTKLFMDYFEKGNTVPPPFNILPTVKILMKLCKSKNMDDAEQGNKTKETRDFLNAKYQYVMRNLVWRYITSQQRHAEFHSVTEDDINEVRQDIFSFRYELMDVLRDSGMNTESIRLKRSETPGKKSKVRQRRLLKDFNITLAGDKVDIGSSNSTPKRIGRVSGRRGTSSQKWQELINACKSRKDNLTIPKSESWKQLLEDEVDLESLTNSALNLRNNDNLDDDDEQEERVQSISHNIDYNCSKEVSIACEIPVEERNIDQQPILTDDALDQLFTFETSSGKGTDQNNFDSTFSSTFQTEEESNIPYEKLEADESSQEMFSNVSITLSPEDKESTDDKSVIVHTALEVLSLEPHNTENESSNGISSKSEKNHINDSVDKENFEWL
ncbi:transient-receptor-potential-like protein [Centruroides sculpturatus]|uniref:transient-receptor-potential-like protein n=1 Tax=Centruroides sculpturatus TaxID=218467 RepID=UPI000C6CF25F|nr:transient-receptor-potential-like protein [Centruroides sculpturatus]